MPSSWARLNNQHGNLQSWAYPLDRTQQRHGPRQVHREAELERTCVGLRLEEALLEQPSGHASTSLGHAGGGLNVYPERGRQRGPEVRRGPTNIFGFGRMSVQPASFHAAEPGEMVPSWPGRADFGQIAQEAAVGPYPDLVKASPTVVEPRPNSEPESCRIEPTLCVWPEGQSRGAISALTPATHSAHALGASTLGMHSGHALQERSLATKQPIKVRSWRCIQPTLLSVEKLTGGVVAGFGQCAQVRVRPECAADVGPFSRNTHVPTLGRTQHNFGPKRARVGRTQPRLQPNSM